MKVGLDPTLLAPAVPVPSAGELYALLLPSATRVATQWSLEDPENAASDAVVKVVIDSHYQDRWKPGEGTIDSYLFQMVQNRLRDQVRSQVRRAKRVAGWNWDSHGTDQSDDDELTDGGIDQVEARQVLRQVRDRAHDQLDTRHIGLGQLFDDLATSVLAGDDVTQKELAARHDVSRTTVRARMDQLRCLAAAEP